MDVEVESIRYSFWTKRLETSVIPVYLDLRHCHLRHVVACREGESDLLCVRARLVQKKCRCTLNLGRIAELETFVYAVQDMACHVSKCSCSEIPPSSEVPRCVDLIVWSHWCRTDECIPIERRRDRLNFSRTLKTLRPDRTVCECLHSSYFSDLSVP